MPDPATLWFVLWTWMAVPWQFAGADMTVGWWSRASYEPQHVEDCMFAVRMASALSIDAQCLPAGKEPTPIARRAEDG